MKVEDHIAMKAAAPKPEPKRLGDVEAMMVTYERPGMLMSTVCSFKLTNPCIKLTVFDDGSSDPKKLLELKTVESLGIEVVRFPHRGFISTWMDALDRARSKSVSDGFVLLEDDLSFAPGWLGVLRRMHDGAAKLGKKPGAMSCLRVHSEPQNAVVSLDGVEAYQSMGHGFQVNLVPREAVQNRIVLREAEVAAKSGGHGLDVNWLGLMSHRMGMTNYISMKSWVAHEGVNSSVVEGQGYRSFRHRGFELVPELEKNSPVV